MSALVCPDCGARYPCLEGVPWLFADPGAAVSEWRNRWQLALARLTSDLEAVERALAAAPNPATRRRLNALAAGYRAQPGHLASLMGSLARANGTALETLLAMRTRLPPGQGIFSYAANVHRDWSWGDDECRAAAESVLEALEGLAPRRVLLLGAGAGRLAYDLHALGGAAVTVALDLNPLLVFTGARVSRGERLQLVEFPLAPRTPEAAAVTRTLSAPAPTRPGLEFVMADVMRAPFREAAFDAVITPWLLDVMGERADTVLRHVNHLLKDDGVWIYHGSVAFDHPDPAERLTAEELAEAAAGAGFGDARMREQTLPYMNCPESRHGRLETVLTLAAAKRSPATVQRPHDSLPAWLVTGRTAVPSLPAFRQQAMATRMHAFIMTLIDGRRSLKDMARLLEEQQLMPRREAETALRGFLTTMYDEAGGGQPPG